jgi:glutamate-1-semialdehyde 2,1-aminomutase
MTGASSLRDNKVSAEYELRTPGSARLMAEARSFMPAGSTRGYGYHWPYPLVLSKGRGARLWDIDGNEYLDFCFNNWALIHGNAYEPISDVIRSAIDLGTAWPGASLPQVRFAKALCERVPGFERVRLCNTGTEAAMLATKVARRVTGRPLILKARRAYHGSSEELEAGIFGNPAVSGRTILATFGDVEQFERLLLERGEEIAGVILEPALCTGVITVPEVTFLQRVEAATRAAGALFILDDSLLFRLTSTGSAGWFSLRPDLTILGKFIGGGLPVGVLGGSAAVLDCLDVRKAGHLYHGGTFNGNPVGCAAGLQCLQDLTADRIDYMNGLADVLEQSAVRAAADVGVPLSVVRIGSILGMYLDIADTEEALSTNSKMDAIFRLACLNRGLYFGTGNDLAMATVTAQSDVDRASEALAQTFTDILPLLDRPEITVRG